jgi:hypothetical protein
MEVEGNHMPGVLSMGIGETPRTLPTKKQKA